LHVARLQRANWPRPLGKSKVSMKMRLWVVANLSPEMHRKCIKKDAQNQSKSIKNPSQNRPKW